MMAPSSNPKKARCISVTLIILGVILVVVGVVLLFELKQMVHDDIAKKIPLRNGTDIYDAWVDPPVPVYMQFWLFDLVNTKDYVDKGAKPILKQKGPYTYKETRTKINLSFSHRDSLISYRQPKSYVFVPEMSNGTENDTITTVNMPLLTVATMLRFYPDWLQKMVQPLLVATGEKLFMEYTVGGYLWGYEEPTLKKINEITKELFNRTFVKNDKFGLFSGATGNGTNDGEYTVYTGRSDLSQYNEIKQWNNQSSVPFWNTTYCNMINGSDGSAWHPFIKKSDTLYIFSSDVCRSVYATYTNEVTVKGIPMYRFTPPDAVLQDHIHNPDNIGYCTPDCLGSGVLNVSRCRQGAPVIVSQPHFYQGSQKYIDAFEGIHPDPKQHATVLDVEPYTGAVLNAAKKLQLNMYIRKLDSLHETRNLNDTIFPMVWLNESALISDAAVTEFKKQMLLPVRVSVILPWVLVAVGILLLIIGLALLIQYLVNTDKMGDGGVGEDDLRRGLLNSSEDHPSYHTNNEHSNGTTDHPPYNNTTADA